MLEAEGSQLTAAQPQWKAIARRPLLFWLCVAGAMSLFASLPASTGSNVKTHTHSTHRGADQALGLPVLQVVALMLLSKVVFTQKAGVFLRAYVQQIQHPIGYAVHRA